MSIFFKLIFAPLQVHYGGGSFYIAMRSSIWRVHHDIFAHVHHEWSISIVFAPQNKLMSNLKEAKSRNRSPKNARIDISIRERPGKRPHAVS